jgi:hypothetical protein
MEVHTIVPRPVGVTPGIDVVAARVDGDGLHPIPSDWLVFFEAADKPPEQLIGKLCVVKVRGQSQPLIREIRRGSTAGLYTLMAWGSGPMENAEIVAAHRIASIAQG